MSPDRTRTLLAAVGEGDAEALEEFVTRHLPHLHAYVRLRMGPQLRLREATADVVQSVCREVLAGSSIEVRDPSCTGCSP